MDNFRILLKKQVINYKKKKEEERRLADEMEKQFFPFTTEDGFSREEIDLINSTRDELKYLQDKTDVAFERLISSMEKPSNHFEVLTRHKEFTNTRSEYSKLHKKYFEIVMGCFNRREKTITPTYASSIANPEE